MLEILGLFSDSPGLCKDGFFPPGLRSMGLAVCLVLRAVSAQAENGRTKGTLDLFRGCMGAGQCPVGVRS